MTFRPRCNLGRCTVRLSAPRIGYPRVRGVRADSRAWRRTHPSVGPARPAWRPTSARRRPRRPVRSWSSRRPARGKTTTLVARIAWLVDAGVAPDAHRRDHVQSAGGGELGERLDAALAPLGVEPGAVRVRTFHALGREILRDAGRRGGPTGRSRRGPAAELAPDGRRGRLRARHGDLAAEGGARGDAGGGRRRPGGRADRADVRRLRAGAGASEAPSTSTTSCSARDREPRVRPGLPRPDGAADAPTSWSTRSRTWTARSCDSRSLLAAPANRILLVGDDDQSIYGWRLADVRRVLGLDARAARAATSRPRGQLPMSGAGRRAGGPARRPQPRAVREADPRGPGGGWPTGPRARPATTTRPSRAGHADVAGRRLDPAVLARTNRELHPGGRGRHGARVARSGPPRLALPLDDPALDGLLAGPTGSSATGRPLLVAIGIVRERAADAGGADLGLATAMLAWAAGHRDVDAFRDAVQDARRPSRRPPPRRRPR